MKEKTTNDSNEKPEILGKLCDSEEETLTAEVFEEIFREQALNDTRMGRG